MLGSEAIVRHKRPRARPRGDVSDKVGIGGGASLDEPFATSKHKGIFIAHEHRGDGAKSGLLVVHRRSEAPSNLEDGKIC